MPSPEAPDEEWDHLAGWWQNEVRTDPAYAEEVLPLLGDLFGAAPRGRYIDLGCGEGQGMRYLQERGAAVVGCDRNTTLLARAAAAGAVVRCRLPDLDWCRPASFDGAIAVLVAEHLADLDRLLMEARRIVRSGGALLLIANHPAFTAPGAGAVFDSIDGSVYWEWGPYFEPSADRQPAGDGPDAKMLTFHHRPLGRILNAAAGAGWALQQFEERSVGEGSAARDALLARQRHIPRLLGVRWRAA